MEMKPRSKARVRITLVGILALCVAGSSIGAAAASMRKEESVVKEQSLESEVHMASKSKKEQKETKSAKDDALSKEIALNLDESSFDAVLSQARFYQAPYIFEIMRFNMKVEKVGLVTNTHTDYTDISINDKKSVRVYWVDRTIQYKEDQEVLDVLQRLLIRMNDVYEKVSKPFEQVIVNDKIDIKENSIEEAEEKFYEEEDTCFSILFPLLKEKEQKKYFKKMMDDSNYFTYYNCIDQVSSKVVEYVAGMAYKRDDLVFFQHAAAHLSKEAKASWIKRCDKDGKYEYKNAFDK